jgi:hypothetical protein
MIFGIVRCGFSGNSFSIVSSRAFPAVRLGQLPERVDRHLQYVTERAGRVDISVNAVGDRRRGPGRAYRRDGLPAAHNAKDGRR